MPERQAPTLGLSQSFRPSHDPLLAEVRGNYLASVRLIRVTRPSDWSLSARIVDQDAIHESDPTIAAIVPNPILADAGNREEARCHPLVSDTWRRISFRQESGRRVIVRICNRLDRQICTTNVSKKSTTDPAVRQLGLLAKYRYWNVGASRCWGLRISATLARPHFP